MTYLRLQKIDLLRGFSVIGMILFHANYILEGVFQRDLIPLPDDFWDILGPTVAICFIFLSGFSYFLTSRERSAEYILRHAFHRVILLWSIALMITFVTWYFIPSQRIFWGIIHFFALSAAIFPIFSLVGKYTIIFWIWFLFLGYFFGDIRVVTDFLIPWGWIPAWFFSADYYPIFPWFGYALIGHGIAYWLYRFHLLGFFKSWWGSVFAPIRYIWRHALWFYVGHAPFLYGIFRLFL